MSFWEIAGFFFWSYVFIAYLMVLFWVIGDIFRDRALNGWLKAVWIIFLLFLPILTTLVYLVFRGGSMADRQIASVYRAQSETDSHIRSVAATSAAGEIAKAKSLLESGTISHAEFDALKARALSGPVHPMAV